MEESRRLSVHHALGAGAGTVVIAFDSDCDRTCRNLMLYVIIFQYGFVSEISWTVFGRICWFVSTSSFGIYFSIFVMQLLIWYCGENGRGAPLFSWVQLRFGSYSRGLDTIYCHLSRTFYCCSSWFYSFGLNLHRFSIGRLVVVSRFVCLLRVFYSIWGRLVVVS